MLDWNGPVTEVLTLIDGAMRINKGLALSLKSCVEQLDWFRSEGMVKEAVTQEKLFDTSYVKTI